MYGNYKRFPSGLKNAQDFGLLSADLRQKVSSVAARLNLPIVEALQKAFVENVVFHKRCITEYGPNQKVKLEEHPGNFVDYCFFCDDGNGTLLSCRSKNLDKNVSEWAENLQDSKLLAKLSEGDLTTTEAKYHKKCLIELYNRVKSKRNDEKSEKELLTIVEGIEWTIFLSIGGSPIFFSIVHSLCFSKSSIHSATHSVSV